MRPQDIIKRVLAVGIGGTFITRPLFPDGGFLVYPVSVLLKDIVNSNGPFWAIIFGIILDLAHFLLGGLVVSLGFESVKKLRKPLAALTAASAILVAGLIGYVTRPY